jgi:uncharacterized membrane protein (DUF485 family)
MSKIIRQAFGSTRPSDITRTLLTFDRLTARPIVHIVYWLGLGLFFIAAMGCVGIAVGSMIKDHTLWGILLSFGVLVVSLLMVMIGIMLWRAFCEFYMAVLSIADDLRVLRQYQEKLEPMPARPQAAPQPQAQPAPTVQPAASRPDPMRFEVPSSEPPASVEPETGNILEDPFFRPRFGKAEQ